MKIVYEFFSRDHGNQGFLAFTYISSLHEFHPITSRRYYSLSNDVAERGKRLDAVG